MANSIGATRASDPFFYVIARRPLTRRDDLPTLATCLRDCFVATLPRNDPVNMAVSARRIYNHCRLSKLITMGGTTVVDHIFISYRREDSADVTGRIHDRLRQHFGEEAIFTDVDKIPLGDDFRAHLDQKMSQCRVLLPVIGRSWLIAKDRQGRLRLEDPDDFVRLEVEAALKRNIPVIPLLVHGIEMPSSEALPEPLRPLAFRNGTPIRRDPDFHKDMDRLIHGLEQHLESRPKRDDQAPVATPVESRKKKSDDSQLLADLYTEGLSAFYTEHWDEAVEIFTKVTAIDSSHEDTAAKLEIATRQQRVSRLYELAHTARAKEDWPAAVKYLQEIETLDAQYRDVSVRLEEARTKRRLQRLYYEARQLRRAEKWQAAITVLDRIESLEADYPDPDGIRDTAKEALAAIARGRQLSDWYSQAVRLLDGGEWTPALQALESIEQIDPAYRETKKLLSHVRRELARVDAENEAAEREQQLAKQYAALEISISIGEYVRASKLIASIETIDPSYKDVNILKKRVAAAKADKEKARRSSPPSESNLARPGALPTERKQGKPSNLPEAVRRIRPIRRPEQAHEEKPAGLPEEIHRAEVRTQPEPTRPSQPTSLPETIESHAKPKDLPS